MTEGRRRRRRSEGIRGRRKKERRVRGRVKEKEEKSFETRQ